MAFIQIHIIEKKLSAKCKFCVMCIRSYPRIEDKLLVIVSADQTLPPSFDAVILELRIAVLEQCVCE